MAGRVSRFGKGQTVRKNAALSLSVHGHTSMSAHARRLTWKRSVVRIHYSPPFVLCAKTRGFRVFSSTRQRARRRAVRVFYNTLQHYDGLGPQGLKVCAQMKLKQTGSVFDNHGLWYYSVQLPGEKKRRQVPLRAPGAKHTMRTDRPRPPSRP